MTMSDHDFSRDTFPWLRSGFDLEGYAGAAASLLVGFLLAIIWWPLFLLGLAGGTVILFATRTARRTPPEAEDLIVAPVDGLVVSVAGARPPEELRLEGGEWTRVRISVGPVKANGISAPMDGAIDHVIRETGDPAAFAAMRPDRAGLTVAFVTLQSGERAIGMRFATGGLGPRLEVQSEPGDAVRLGRGIGTLRLGGWCDLYVDAALSILPQPGQTLVGSETVIAQFDTLAAEQSQPEVSVQRETQPVPDAPSSETEVANEDASLDEEGELTLQALTEDDAVVDAEEEDVSEMFARLRKEAQKIQDGD